MKNNYKRLGDYIQKVDVRNTEDLDLPLMGLTIDKKFIPSVANTIGTDLSKYKVVYKNQFACSLMQVSRDGKLPIARLNEDSVIMSPAYPIFEVINVDELLPEYLEMWFKRSEFDREAAFYAVGGVRGNLTWEDFIDLTLPIPYIEKQRQIVADYQAIENKIKANETICEKLEETAQTIYRRWFEEFEFPDEDGKPYKSNGGEMVWNEEYMNELPKEWKILKLEKLASLKYGKMLDSKLFQKEGYPVFSGYGIRGYYSEFMYEEPQILVLCRGVSGTGEVKMSPHYSYITNLSIVVENDLKKINKQFLFYYLNNSDLRSLDSGSAQSMITTRDLNRFEVIIPCAKIQSLFGREIKRIKSFKRKAKIQNQKLQQLQELLLMRMTITK